jgi:hypothetical protein
MATKQFDNYADLITFTRASTATYLDSDGLLKSATTNTPRIEYDANGNRLGLLIEEARTNLLLYSEVVGNTGWTDNGSTSTNLTDSALGVWDGVSVATNGKGFHFINSDTISVTTGDVLTFRVWVKAGTSNRLRINLRQVEPISASRVRGEFGSLAADSDNAGTITSVKEEDWGNGIVAVSGTITVNFTGDFQLGIGPDSETAGNTVIAYAAQLEAGSFPTSYIPTTGATATRAADVASIPTSAFGYNQKAGTVVCEFDTQFGPTGFPVVFDIGSTSTGVNRVQAYINASASEVRTSARANNVSAADFVVKVDPSPASGKVAFAFADNDFAGVAEGGSVVTDTSGSFTTPSLPRDRFTFGGATNTTNGNINGHIKSIQYYPRRLTNAQLQRITQ